MRRSAAARLLPLLAVLCLVSPVGALESWRALGGTATLSVSETHLATLGLSLAAVRETASPPEEAEHSMEPRLLAFALASGATVSTENGVFREFGGGISFQGGFALRTHDPRSGAGSPAFLFDFSLEMGERDGRRLLRARSSDPSLPVPLEIHNLGITFDPVDGRLAILMGDVQISPAWAAALARPDLAGRWIGAFDLRLEATLVSGELSPPGGRASVLGGGSVLDVVLGELYGITSIGRAGTYPDGVAALSAATTSCNNGEVDVPWNAPMAETHPFIGLALFREKDGILEMIGKNWLKHGWFALANQQCSWLTCVGGGGTYLAIGCSDTYSVANNGARYYLGPREEINPFTAEWEACGSHFDGTPVDCQRSHGEDNHNDVDHRLEVHDEDLGNVNADSSAARYYYEGVYYVASDDTTANNIGWRECTVSWGGADWTFDTLGFPLAPNPGPVVEIWGDRHDTKQVAPDDGDVVLAVQVTDLGGGQWHYEYALYNRHSDRGVHSFSVPVGSANLTNVGFRDIDRDGANDWASSVADGVITWATDDFATDPGAPALTYQTLFNFRFDADQPPVPAAAAGGIFKPGIGTSFLLFTDAPFAGTTSVLAGASDGQDFTLSANEPNPFSESTELSFSLPATSEVRLSVLDVAGRTVQVLLAGPAPAGATSVRWDGRDSRGARVASGVYFFRLDTEAGARNTKGIFLR